MGKIIGIDFGTSNSCVAVFEGGAVKVIPNAEGETITPSIVAWDKDGELLVGLPAKRQAVTNPKRTFYAIKRLFGRGYDDPEVQALREILPYPVIKGRNGAAWVSVDDEVKSPEQVAAQVFKYLKESAEAYLSQRVTQAAVAVPSNFNDTQRKAVQDAARIAGLDALRIINEPTAAALAYGLDKSEGERKVAVYDFGGGTFDISILDISDKLFEVRATSGDSTLGGEDLDMALLRHLADGFQRSTGADLTKDPMALQRLKEAAEAAKRDLSGASFAYVNLPFISADASGPKHLSERVTRETADTLFQPFVDRTKAPCERALQESLFTREQIDDVVLVGGTSRVPLVRTFVREFFGQEPRRGLNPDEIVAIGAAIQGAISSGEAQDMMLLDVLPQSIGIETQGGVFTRIIDRNTAIPTSKSQTFSTAEDNQHTVTIRVYQGEREMAADNKQLGSFDLENIPPAPRGVPMIEVGFNVDSNGMLHVTATDKATGREKSVRVSASSRLSDAEIEKMVADAQTHADDDKKRRDAAEARNGLDALIHSVAKSMEEYGSLAPTDAYQEIEAALQSARGALNSGEAEVLERAALNLAQVSVKLGEAIYNSAEAPAAEKPQPAQPQREAPRPEAGKRETPRQETTRQQTQQRKAPDATPCDSTDEAAELQALLGRLMAAARDGSLTPEMEQQLMGLLKRVEKTPESARIDAGSEAAAAAEPKTKIFISYRRSSAQWIVGRLYDRLASEYGSEAIFIDVDKIPFGVDFRDHIRMMVRQCYVMLAVISQDWINERAGRPMRSTPDDFVRLELEYAMSLGVPIIPVLEEGSRMPTPQEVPETLAKLPYLNAAAVDPGRDFHAHVKRLMVDIERLRRGKAAH